MAKRIGSLRLEAEAELAKLSGIFEKAIDGAFGDISDELKNQIERNVYDKWPNVKEYQRRWDRGGLLDVNRYFTYSPFSIGTNGNNIHASVELEYAPSGDQWQWEEPAEENEFIHRVESGEGYEWKTYDPPQRPFWRPFVYSMEGRSKIADAIDSELASRLKDFDYEGGVSIELQRGDGDYSY